MATAPKSPPTQQMTADEFVAWASVTPGRFELVRGTVVVMSSEPVEHLEVKGNCYTALRSALERARVAGAPVDCHALPDGMSVRATSEDVFEPDALVYCGARLPRGTMELGHPTVVIDVGSPSTAHRDQTFKLMGYAQISSLQHYILVHPLKRQVIHHARHGTGFLTRILANGQLTLSPPGITIDIDELYA
jgi:Uma2 family endonuclease